MKVRSIYSQLFFTSSAILCVANICAHTQAWQEDSSRLQRQHVFLKKKVIDYERNLVSTCNLSSSLKLSFDWDQLVRFSSLVVYASAVKCLAGLSPQVAKQNFHDGIVPDLPIDGILCLAGGLCVNGLARLVMICKELGRGEMVRALEQTSILNPWVSVYLLIQNDQPDRLTIMRVLKLLSLTVVGTVPAIIGLALHDPIMFFCGLCKGQFPIGLYSSSGFDKKYGDEYRIIDSDMLIA